MELVTLTRIIAIAALVLGALGILVRLGEIMNRPFKQDLALQRGSIRRGVLFAFTLGMAPWEKESTRIHWFAYLRGIFFHVGIFTSFGVLFASPWLDRLPQALIWVALGVTAVGAVTGFSGMLARRLDDNQRALSLPDDYFSVFLTSLFVALAAVSLVVPGGLPIFYVVTAVMAVYIPWSKIRHCVYFFYSKFFFGFGFGRRGVIGQAPGEYAERG